MGCSQNYGPLSVIDCIAAANIQGYQNVTLILNPKRDFGTAKLSHRVALKVAVSVSWV